MGLLSGRLGYWVLKAIARKPGSSLLVQLRRISLTQRFGPNIWSDLQGLRVLDFGCGDGRHSIELAEHGIEAVGIDIQDRLLAAARAEAQARGLTCTFVNARDSQGLQGKFDVVISVNSFEHFSDPAGVLMQMHGYAKPGGMVLIYFSPPWKHPYGPHLGFITRIPWPHAWFSESTLMAVRSEYVKDGATRFEDVEGGLNRMTIAKFEALVAESPFQMERLELLPIRGISWFTRNRITREYLCSAVRARLRK